MTTARLHLLALACALLVATPAKGATTRRPVAPAKASAAAAATRRAAEPTAPAARRLEDVHIEGELEVPRVTFITVRQPHRFTDYTRATSVRPARRMAADATFPAWIATSPTPASDTRKENRK